MICDISTVKCKIMLNFLMFFLGVSFRYVYYKMPEYSVVFTETSYSLSDTKEECIKNLYFKISNVEKKDGKISCNVEVPYAVIKNKAFKERNFLIRTAIIAKNYLLNIVFKILLDDKEIINLEKQIPFKFRNKKGHIKLKITVRDFFAFVRKKKYRFETILTNNKKFLGFKFVDNQNSELYFFKTSNFFLKKKDNTYMSVNYEKIDKKQFQQILHDFKKGNFTEAFFEKYPIFDTACFIFCY